MTDKEKQLWYELTLTTMWLELRNYSEISRRTHIPRNTISKIVRKTIEKQTI
jgi:hypothetical protein